MSSGLIRIATRKSPLAIWQAEHVRARLESLHPDLQVELVVMSTQGDRVLNSPLAKIGGKGLFVKELEQGMLEGRADIAVHSMKDVPAEFPDGLELGVVLAREDPHDAFVSNQFTHLDELPQGAMVGTSSLRRQCQLRAHRPDLQIRDLRGNVGTRLSKLDAGEFDAIVLACAGLKRLEMETRITQTLSAELMLPAIGQGAIGIECRSGDTTVQELIAPLNDPVTANCVQAERAMNARLAGGCQAPVAGFAQIEGDTLHLRGLVGWPDGSEVIHGENSGDVNAAASIGTALAEDLLSRGAKPILDQLLEADD